MWTVIFSVLIALALTGSLLAILSGVRSAAAVAELQRLCRDLSKSAPQSLVERISELESTVEVLANRVKMSRVRTIATHAERKERDKDAEPDPRSDPEAWRTWMNARLRSQAITRGN